MAPPRTPTVAAASACSPRSPPRSSRFIEGPPTTFPLFSESHPSDPTSYPVPPTSSNALLFSILSEQDAAESRRKHQHTDSSASSESLPSSFGSSSSGLRTEEYVPIEGRRSINFGSGEARRSIDGWVKGVTGEDRVGVEYGLKKFKGRLRALTGSRNEDVKPYEGT
jgi:hypothetical protein